MGSRGSIGPGNRRRLDCVNSKRFAVAFALLVAMVVPARQAGAANADPRRVRLTFGTLSTGLASPVAVATASDGSGRIYIGEQAGRIRLRIPNGLVSAPFLDITDRVLDGGERGLLGIAFHPQYYANGNFYVYYTDNEGDVRVSRFHTTPGSFTAPASSEVVLLDIAHRENSNHNGGAIAFGKDGYLYLGIGDGGGSGDPRGNAQNNGVLLGKILRIDVNRACSPLRYCIPSTNPLVRSTTARKEIWHNGVRNPWRVTFDLRDGPIWIADVGQSEREEIDTLSGGVGGRNLGWDCREGTRNTVSQYGGTYCTGRSFTPPIFEYGHASGRCSITGGYVYRGAQYASLLGGIYVYADYCTGEVWGIARLSDGRLYNALLYDHAQSITSFGQAPNGDLYAVDSSGGLFKLNAAAR